MVRGAARQPLPALYADVDKPRLQFDQPGAPASAFRRNQGGAGTAKGIKDQPTPLGAQADAVIE
jgi:hypothetical protein